MKRSIIFAMLLALSCVSAWSVGAISAKRTGQSVAGNIQKTDIHAASGNPLIKLSDGFELSGDFSGESDVDSFLKQGMAQPLAMASADFDEDGVPDLISTYAV